MIFSFENRLSYSKSLPDVSKKQSAFTILISAKSVKNHKKILLMNLNCSQTQNGA